jgi:TonB-linked SusC/RagA family outer membrane protein
MKKFEIERGCVWFKPALKTLLTMKLIFLLVCGVGLLTSVAEKSYAQSTKLTFALKNTQIKAVLEHIENNSEFSFMYENNVVDVDTKVDIAASDETIDVILNRLLGDNTEYRVIGRHIVLFPSGPKPGETLPALSQQPAVSGTVTDESGLPLPGVTVMVKGTAQGTVTNADGNYTLSNIQEDATLVFSFVGMRTQEVEVGNQTTINIKMELDAIGIEEVVAIGYGTQKRINLTGSVSSINSEELTKRPSYSVGTLIQGKATGLQIIQQSGEPGNEKLKIAIRGQGTFSSAGSNPLVVVDGVAYPSWTGLNNLDPESIQSIDILKDAASASIYGARAANGVIIVTTKKGIMGKPTITYSGSAGFQNPTFLPDYIDNSAEYMEMYNYTVARQGTGTIFNESLIEAYRNADPNDPQYPNFDWRDEIINPGWGQKHNLSFSGGNDITKFYTDFGYYDQDAILRGQSYKRYNVQFNLETKIADWITFGTNITGLTGKKKGPATSINTLMQNVWDMNPTTSPRLPDGRWSVGAVSAPYTLTGNMVRLTDTGGDGGTRLNESHNITASGFLNIKIIPELIWNITGSYSYEENFTKVHQRIPAEPNEYYFQTGAFARVMSVVEQGVADTWRRSVMPSLYSTLNYTKTFSENHNLRILGGYSQEYNQSRFLFGKRRDYSFPDLTEISPGDPTVQTLNGTASEWAIQSFFGRIGYDYKGKYLFEANARYDGTSRIQKDNRWGLFPSFSVGWRVSEENFMKSADWIDNLKVRGSWGQLGNQNIGLYPYQSLLATTNYAQGTGVAPGVLKTTLADPSLKWEVTTISNVGLDLDVKKGLFSLIFDMYNKDTDGILNRAEVPLSLGQSAPFINYGAMNNKGFEFIMGHRNKIKELEYFIDFNYSRNRNKITQLVTPSYGLRSNQVGHEYGAHYMIEWIGVFQNQAEIDAAPKHPFNPKPGDLIFKDQNGDGVINADDRVILPGRFPKFLYGGNLGFNWKNIDFSVFVQGVAGTKHYITRRGEWPFLRMAPPTKEWRNAWTPENPTNEMPALYAWPYNPVSGNNNSYFLKNTSYVRLKNIQIGYTLPGSITKDIGIQNLRVYVSADNWFTFAPYTIHDPERDEDVQYGGQTEAGQYPNVKTLTFGVKLNIN